MTNEVLPLPTRRGLNREEAAAYVGLSPNSFDELMRAGVFPKPVDLAGLKRRVWDVKALDAAFDRRLGAVMALAAEEEWSVRRVKSGRG